MAQIEHVQIDSHSSKINNQRIIELLALADKLSINAGNNYAYPDINAYYNILEQIYINIAPALNESYLKEIEELRKNFSKLKYFVMHYKKYRIMKTFETMFSFCRQFNFKLISGLQHHNFFFRVSKIAPKGLNNIKFFQPKQIESEQNDI